MNRPFALTIVVLSISLFPRASSAEETADTSESPELEYRNGNWVRVPPVPGINIASEDVSKLLFLNRCRGGCTITPGLNDARFNTSRIINGTSRISEWDLSEEAWQEMMTCVRELYAPYDIRITDVDPGNNIFHHEAIVAGTYDEIGLETAFTGYAPSQCAPINNVISFTFANMFEGRAIDICHTVGQETAHSYGLEHARDCSDPMTYMPTCSRQFFRDAATPCGEFTDLDRCNCGGTAQNSHRWLQAVLGDSQEALVGPVVNIQSPAQDQAVFDGFPVSVTATHVRGIGTVELFLNGTSYAIQDAHPREMAGFPYEFVVPSDLSDGIIDVEIRATNDIGTETIAMVSVQKGEPCTGQSSCQNKQNCEDGRCVIPPAVGMLGDSCTTGEDCISGLCPVDAEGGICSVTCFPTTTEETCSAGFTCTQTSPGRGVCWPKSESGSCGCNQSTSGGATSIVLLLMVLWGFRRRARP